MATYPIKILKDENGNEFVPLTGANAIVYNSEETLQDKLDRKLEKDNIIAGTNITLQKDGNNITINSSGGSGSDSVFYATYGATRYGAILAAYNAHKLIYVYRADNTTTYCLTRFASDTFYFRSFGSSSNINYGVYISTDNVWHPSSYTYATLSSPAFSGTPTAPTPNVGTDNTQIATTAFVHNAISAIPEKTNIYIATCGETSFNDILAAYNDGKHIILRENLADNTVRFFPLDTYNPDLKFFDFKNFIANSPTGSQQVTGWQINVNNVWTPVIMNLAKLGSPSFTGTPTAPTAAAGTNTSQIATTAFVQNATDKIAKYISADCNLWDLDDGFYRTQEGIHITFGSDEYNKFYCCEGTCISVQNNLVEEDWQEGVDLYVVAASVFLLGVETIITYYATDGTNSYPVAKEVTEYLETSNIHNNKTDDHGVYTCEYINNQIDPNGRNMTVGTLSSKNLLNIHEVTYATSAYSYLDDDTITIDYVSGAVGYCIFNKIDNNTGIYSSNTYTISDSGGSTAIRILIQAFNSYGNKITDLNLTGFTYNSSYNGYYKDHNNGINTTFKLPSRVDHFNIGFVTTNASDLTYYQKVLLEKGSTATEYSKYQSFNYINNNYSRFTEINTGKTWVNGKVIYKKSFYISALPNNTTLKLSVPLWIATITNCEMSFVDNARGINYILTGDSRVRVNGLTLQGDEVIISTTEDLSNYSGYLTLEYTKLNG